MVRLRHLSLTVSSFRAPTSTWTTSIGAPEGSKAERVTQPFFQVSNLTVKGTSGASSSYRPAGKEVLFDQHESGSPTRQTVIEPCTKDLLVASSKMVKVTNPALGPSLISTGFTSLLPSIMTAGKLQKVL